MDFMSQTKTDEYEIAKAMEKARDPGDVNNVWYSHMAGYRADAAYNDLLERSRKDFTRNVPLKVLHEFSNSGNEGLYGFTYLGSMMMGRNERLRGTERGLETDVHECIHTEWEYETRVLTKWMMEGLEEKYKVN
jgi:hypothetical protein